MQNRGRLLNLKARAETNKYCALRNPSMKEKKGVKGMGKNRETMKKSGGTYELTSRGESKAVSLLKGSASKKESKKRETEFYVKGSLEIPKLRRKTHQLGN